MLGLARSPSAQFSDPPSPALARPPRPARNRPGARPSCRSPPSCPWSSELGASTSPTRRRPCSRRRRAAPSSFAPAPPGPSSSPALQGACKAPRGECRRFVCSEHREEHECEHDEHERQKSNETGEQGAGLWGRTVPPSRPSRSGARLAFSFSSCRSSPAPASDRTAPQTPARPGRLC